MHQLQPAPSPVCLQYFLHVMSSQEETKTKADTVSTSCYNFLFPSHLTPNTFSLTLHKPWTLNYSSCYFNDPLGLAQRITEEWLPNLPSFHHHLLIVFLLSVCSWAKNNWPPAVIWAGYPSLVMQDVRWAEVVYWINVVAKGCVDPGSNRRIKEWCLLLK